MLKGIIVKYFGSQFANVPPIEIPSIKIMVREGEGNEMHDTNMQCRDMQYAGHEYDYQVYQNESGRKVKYRLQLYDLDLCRI